MKGLGWQLPRVPNIAGATILGDGGLGVILDARDLLASAGRVRPSGSMAVAVAAPARKRILIVEDSITARTLFKHVLEAAGYAVRTAVDGVDGWTELSAERFDLVVSDIEMPRMDGIELTSRIRRSENFAEIPVILISSLDSREDRERGVDAGANAYVVKRSFDQQGLLDMVRRLIR
jgi:two-component system chemotaxis sensor kinase CheA